MIEQADSILIAHSTAGGGLEKLIKEKEIKKPIVFLSNTR